MSTGINSNPFPLGRLTPNQDEQDFLRSAIRAAPRVLPKKYKAVPRRSNNIRRFRNMRERNQKIGSCSGESSAAMLETGIITPDHFTDDSQPNEAVDISALWCYYIGRKYAVEYGGFSKSLLSDEGGFASTCKLGIKKFGAVEYKYWPSTDENYQDYYRQEKTKKGPAEAEASTKIFPIDDIGMLMSFDGTDASLLSYLAAGYSVNAGSSWPENATQANFQTGAFAWSGKSVGGHAYEVLDYDLDKDVIWIGNSWWPWGLAGSIGYTKLSVFAKTFTSQKLKTFDSELSVICGVEGFEPKIAQLKDYIK